MVEHSNTMRQMRDLRHFAEEAKCQPPGHDALSLQSSLVDHSDDSSPSPAGKLDVK